MPDAAFEPPATPRPPAVVLAALPLIAAVALACTVNAAAWVERVYPGFFLWENGFVPAVGAIGSPAVAAGLRYQSRLVAVDGTPVGGRAEVEARIAAQPAGTPFRYTFERAGTTYDVTLPSTHLDLPTFALTLGNYLFNALAFLALGVAIVFLEPESRSARTFFAFCVVFGLWLATSIDLMGPGWFQSLYFVLVNLGPVVALQLALDFPAVNPALARARRLLPPLYAVALALGIASVVAFSRSFATLLALDRVTHLSLVVAFLGALAVIVLALRRAATRADRARLAVFLLGLAGASFVPALVLAAVYTADAAVPLNYLTLGFALFPAAMAYAIARQDLFGVDRFVRQTVAYVSVTVAIGLLYATFLALVDYFVLPDMDAAPAIHVLVTIGLVMLFNPLRSRVHALVDVLFFRTPYDYRATVTAATHALASILDLDELLARLGRIITEPMQVERVTVWLRDPSAPVYRPEGAPARALAADSALVRWLASPGAGPLHRSQRVFGRRPSPEARAELVAVGADLAVPMRFEQRLVGFLALGARRSGAFYAADDLDLLATLASQAAVAVENARAYRALARANRELREARDQLVEAERLAAIGELSAAVAHGIRNPVAGIKTAAELAVRDAGPNDRLRESFVDILTEADALESRISELLDFARPFTPNLAPADLNTIVRGSLHLLRRQLAERHVAVDFALAEALPTHELDEAQIEQVCLALVMNALEAMPAGGRLRVATETPGTGEIALVIGDTGHGIPPEEQAKVFRLFYTRKAHGTGVGLATVKRIVEAHRGRIELRSAVGDGTEFRIALPCDPGRGVEPNGRDGTAPLAPAPSRPKVSSSG